MLLRIGFSSDIAFPTNHTKKQLVPSSADLFTPTPRRRRCRISPRRISSIGLQNTVLAPARPKSASVCLMAFGQRFNHGRLLQAAYYCATLLALDFPGFRLEPRLLSPLPPITSETPFDLRWPCCHRSRPSKSERIEDCLAKTSQ